LANYDKITIRKYYISGEFMNFKLILSFFLYFNASLMAMEVGQIIYPKQGFNAPSLLKLACRKVIQNLGTLQEFVNLQIPVEIKTYLTKEIIKQKIITLDEAEQLLALYCPESKSFKAYTYYLLEDDDKKIRARIDSLEKEISEEDINALDVIKTIKMNKAHTYPSFPLLWTACAYYKNAVPFFLEMDERSTANDLSTVGNDIALAEMLIAAGAPIEELSHIPGRSPFIERQPIFNALLCNHEEKIKLLLENGGSLTKLYGDGCGEQVTLLDYFTNKYDTAETEDGRNLYRNALQLLNKYLKKK
jgi:hypothetical protein